MAGFSSTKKHAGISLRTSGQTSQANDEMYRVSSDGNAAIDYDLVDGSHAKVYLEFEMYLDSGASPPHDHACGCARDAFDWTGSMLLTGSNIDAISARTKDTVLSGDLASIASGGSTNLGLGGPIDPDAPGSDVYQVAFDPATRLIWFGLNNTWSGDPAAGTGHANQVTSGAPYRFGGCVSASDATVIRVRSLSRDQFYTPPAGFSALPDPPVDAEGETDLGLVLDAEGRLENSYGQAEFDLGLNLDAEGRLSSSYGDAEFDLGLALDAEGRLASSYGLGEFDLGLILDAEGRLELAPVHLTAPSAIIDATGLSGEVGTSELTATLFEIASTSFPGTVSSVELIQPAAILTSEFVGVELTAPVAVLESEGLTGTIGTAVLISKPAVVAATGVNLGFQSATLVPASPTLTSIALTGGIGTAFLTPRAPVMAATAAGGQFATVALIAPAPLLSSSVATGILATAFLTAPRAVLSSSVEQALNIFTTWCMNVEAPSLTNYTNFDFHSLAQLGDVYLGADNTGFYALAGADDVGTAIPATLRFGFTDFESPQLKRVPAVYLSGRFNGAVNLLIKIDGEETEWEYPLDPVQVNLKNHLIKPGRGLCSLYWQLGLSNVLGSDFELDVINIAEQILSRRVG